MATVQFPNTSIDYFPLRGGLNLVTPPLSMPDGVCRDAMNFECQTDGGYKRTAGYERYDGRSSPSSKLYYYGSAVITGSWSVGDTLTGVSSGATGKIIAGGVDYFVLARVTGSFVASEVVSIGGGPVATLSSTGIIASSAPTQELSAIYTNLVADEYRTDIQAVPGSGSIRGVWVYNDKVYAFRDNVLGTAGGMYVSSSSGWTSVSLGYQLSFITGTAIINDGDTVTGLSSGASGIVKRVAQQSGSWASNAAGVLVFASITGSFTNGENLQVGGSNKAICSGSQSAITLPSGGRYSFVNNNFGGAANSTKMYGCNGIGKAFEFDGTTFVPITTGMTSDTPLHIAAHSNHLFLSFDGSVQNSSIGAPYMWTPLTGAGEIALGDTVTGFVEMAGNSATAALGITTKGKTSILYGTSSADWQLATLSFESGGFPYTSQQVGSVYLMDEIGIRQVAATQKFGNFEQAQISHTIRPYILDRITKVKASCVSRMSNQYRLFFNDMTAIYVSFYNNEIIGMMPMSFAHTVECICSAKASTGDEMIVFGSSNGYVYQMEKGTSFDGEPIIANLNLAFNHAKSPRTRKRYRKLVYEVSGSTYASFESSYELSYGSTETPQGTTDTLNQSFGSVVWDSFTWDAFIWDGRNLSPLESSITGTAENISLIIRSSSDEYAPFTINAAILHYTSRRNLR